MIRKNEELRDITDDEFNSIVAPFDNKIYEHISKNILDEFIAYFISTGYEMNALWDGKLDLTIGGAIEMLAQMDNSKCDVNKIKSILEEKYKLKITSDIPLEIEELN